MFNLFPLFSANTAIFNDAPQPWQLGFQDGASPIFIYCMSVVFLVSIPVLISSKNIYREKYNKQLNFIANVLICISIICFFYVLWKYMTGLPIECAPELPSDLELRKDANRSMSENTKAALTLYTGMVGSVGAAVIKTKAGSPGVKAGIFAGTVIGGGYGIKGMLETGNKVHLGNMSGPVYARAGATPSTPNPDLARQGEEVIELKIFIARSPNEVKPNSTGSPFWDSFAKFVPDWVNQDIISRLPSTTGNGTYHILFMQYNLFVYIMCMMFVFTLFCIVLISVLTMLKNNREYLVEKVLPTFIVNFLPSKSVLEFMILVNKLSLIVHAMAYGYALYFLYMNPIPGDLGMLCDSILAILFYPPS